MNDPLIEKWLHLKQFAGYLGKSSQPGGRAASFFNPTRRRFLNFIGSSAGNNLQQRLELMAQADGRSKF
jgi:hypothetical protein